MAQLLGVARIGQRHVSIKRFLYGVSQARRDRRRMGNRYSSQDKNYGECRNTSASAPGAIVKNRMRSASRKQHPRESAPRGHFISRSKLGPSALGASSTRRRHSAGFGASATWSLQKRGKLGG